MQSISPDLAKFADFRWKNTDVSKTQGVCHVIYIFFGKFHHCRICVTDFKEGKGAFWPPSWIVLTYVFCLEISGGLTVILTFWHLCSRQMHPAGVLDFTVLKWHCFLVLIDVFEVEMLLVVLVLLGC